MNLNLKWAKISVRYALKGLVESYIRFSLYPDFYDLLTFSDLVTGQVKTKPIYSERTHQDE